MAKKEISTKVDESAVKEAKALIDSRRPKLDGVHFFKLINGSYRMISPKFTFTSSDGVKVKIRYNKEFNTIFEDDQDNGGYPVKTQYIVLDKHNQVSDKALIDFLLLHPVFGKGYTVVDPAGNAEKELRVLEAFDDVWDKVRSLTEEQLKALILLLMPSKLVDINNKTIAELRLMIRHKAQTDTQEVAESLESPLLRTLYLYHMALELGEIKYDKKSGYIIWTDNKKEIIRIPEDKDPGMVVARALLQEDNIRIRELLEEKING